MRKRCKKCGKTKPLDAFYRDSAARDRHRPECKGCTSARRKAWYAANRDREIRRVLAWQARNREYYNARQREYRRENREAERRGHLWRTFGLAPEDYEQLLIAQGGRCAICGKEPGKISLHVDHDHGNGEVRGLLCFRCNGGLGQFGEDAGRLARAAEYLDGGASAVIVAEELVAAARRRAYAVKAPAA